MNSFVYSNFRAGSTAVRRQKCHGKDKHVALTGYQNLG